MRTLFTKKTTSLRSCSAYFALCTYLALLPLALSPLSRLSKSLTAIASAGTRVSDVLGGVHVWLVGSVGGGGGDFLLRRRAARSDTVSLRGWDEEVEERVRSVRRVMSDVYVSVIGRSGVPVGPLVVKGRGVMMVLWLAFLVCNFKHVFEKVARMYDLFVVGGKRAINSSAVWVREVETRTSVVSTIGGPGNDEVWIETPGDGL